MTQATHLTPPELPKQRRQHRRPLVGGPLAQRDPVVLEGRPPARPVKETRTTLKHRVGEVVPGCTEKDNARLPLTRHN